jgi:hypothetical protein
MQAQKQFVFKWMHKILHRKPCLLALLALYLPKPHVPARLRPNRIKTWHMDGSAVPRIFRRAENSASTEWTVEPSHQKRKGI